MCIRHIEKYKNAASQPSFLSNLKVCVCHGREHPLPPEYLLYQTKLFVQVGTTRIIWSFSNNDPSDPLGETAVAHNYQGSVSINLLGGLASPPSEPADLQSFDLTISDVSKTQLSYIP